MSRPSLAGLPIADSEDVLTQLADAVDEAQLEMRHIIAERPDFQGMGTTVTVVCWQGDRASIAHVGDSWAYMLRNGELQANTFSDHTLTTDARDAGQITPRAGAHPPPPQSADPGDRRGQHGWNRI